MGEEKVCFDLNKIPVIAERKCSLDWEIEVSGTSESSDRGEMVLTIHA